MPGLLLRHAPRPWAACGAAARAAQRGLMAVAPSGPAQERGSSSWKGHGSQEDLMRTDQCITVTEGDRVTGGGSKRSVHVFDAAQPKGVLHRAFSVFLFNSRSELLLQQRAPGKITFPGLWTNTCCSHPLHGQDPCEVDTDADVASGAVPAVKHAAVRKLQHELGIPQAQLPASAFRYLTRLHYCAADHDPSTGQPTGWGEHEMDYILFAQADVDLAPNPEEVAATEYVTQERLAELMGPGSGRRWSPWFRIIARQFLGRWWGALPQALHSDAFLDSRTIHRLSAD